MSEQTTIECKHEKWSNDPDCECTVNHCIYCDATEVSIHAEEMEALCAKQETEITGLEDKVSKYENALSSIARHAHQPECPFLLHGVARGPCCCHCSEATRALT